VDNGSVSRAQIGSLASSMSFPSKAFIDGRWVAAISGLTFPTTNPATGELLGHLPACDAADVDLAVISAETAFARRVWVGKTPAERKAVLKRLASLIDRETLSLATLESLESGKPVGECLNIDVPDTARTIEWFGECADKIYEHISPGNGASFGMIVREPLGVVSAVLPWNFPLMMLAWKIGPALATGNSIIVKPAEQTSMTALRVAELALEAGLPPGVFNVVTGWGETAGRSIGTHPRINAISFTGSTEVGRLFLMHSAASNLKRVTLECGGKNPAVILSDANVEEAAHQSVMAAFWNMGQNCTANSRLIVHKNLKEDFVRAFVDETRKWKTGDPLDPDNRLGSLISVEHRNLVAGHVERALSEGAELCYQGSIEASRADAFFAPTLLTNVTPSMQIFHDEVFGPVTAVIVADTDEHAITLANHTCYGLQASLYSRDISRAHAFARQLNAGTVSVNCYSEGDISTPFGGFKQSGFGGRDKSVFAFDQYLEKKTIWVNQ
jgi:gamma-glutamyl-gamma-aminobutyraldehyde dehydrogenase